MSSSKTIATGPTPNSAIGVAVGLQRLGVKQGDHVAVWLPNSRDALLIFYAINYLGAVFVPFNTAYRGNLLEHVLRNSDATLLVAHAGLLERLDGCDASLIDTVVVVGGGTAHARFTTVDYADLSGVEADLAPLPTYRAVAQPVDHLHLGHYWTVEGRAVVVPALVHQRRPGGVAFS